MAKALLGMGFAELNGAVGDFLVVSRNGGAVLRRKPTYKRPTSPGQAAQAKRMAQAIAVWRGFSAEQAQAWDAYARTLSVRFGDAPPTGYNAFLACAMRTLMAQPDATPAAWPPQRAFEGDRVQVTATAVTGGIRFHADAPNTDGVATELLVQRLPNVRRKPTNRYKSAQFVTYIPGVLATDVPVEPGVYACAIRFVKPDTGQAMVLEVLEGLVVVG